MNYNDFEQETKIFINKAIDIYLIIKEKVIERNIKYGFSVNKYTFTKLDKKVLSLFIAGFLIEGNLKKILSEYDDIKLNDLFEFIDIKKENIKPLSIRNYEEIFANEFKLDLMTIIKERNWDFNVNLITPEVIIGSLQHMGLSGSRILDYYFNKYHLKESFNHPVFQALKNYNLENGNISKKTNRNNSSYNFSLSSKMTLPHADNFSKKEKSTNIIDDSVWDILDEIQKKFIGQEEAVEGLFYNIINNQQLAEIKNIPDGQKSIIFMDGPTGTGKTAITRDMDLCQVLGHNFLHIFKFVFKFIPISSR